ncbi:MAG: ATP-binding protein [Verrucomicrobia bacterium]|nr:MAG: ATP-binding protein [Verrucomicrobiota bacterium]
MNSNLPTTRLASIELGNFRCFSNLSVSFHERLTVLVAPNGGGKTSILDALAIALWPFPCTMLLKETSPGFDPEDMRRVRSRLGTMQKLSPVSVKAVAYFDGEENPIEWQRFRKSVAKGTRTSRSGAAKLQKFAQKLWYQNVIFTREKSDVIPTYPLMAYYGTGRLWDQSRLTFGKLYRNKPDTGRESGYEDSLSPKSSYKLFVDWFGRFSGEAQGEKDSGIESLHKPSEKLRALTQAVDTLLKPTGWNSLAWDSAEKRPIATHPDHGVLPVDLLSDGLRNTIGLAADIAHRCARINPQFGENAAILTPGIVMIDEVDMHLHPEWQQLVLDALQNAFPLIQFIVTTHSPQVLSTVKRESIRRLFQDGNGEWIAAAPEEETKGIESSTAMNDVMGVNQIPPVPESKWRYDYTALIENGEHQSAEGIELRNKLQNHYGEQHPIIRDFDRLIRFQTFKLKLNNRD